MMPLGYGGLYALMSEQISANHFLLPSEVPFYGPGGIPFAYPPLAFYVMAFGVQLMDVTTITYLRFAPSIFSSFSLVLVFLIADRIIRSKIAAVIAVVLVVFSPSLYNMHIWAAGVVRGLAFLLMLCGILFLHLSMEQKGNGFAILAGLFFGLTVLTHLFYGLFFALWLFIWSGIQLNRLPWKKVFFIILMSVLLILPWVSLMVARYKWVIFLNAFSSHDNAAFIEVITTPGILSEWIGGKFSLFSSNPFSIILIGLGLLYLINLRQVILPLVFLPMEGSHFIELLGAICIGAGCIAMIRWSARSKWLNYSAWGFAILVLLIHVRNGIPFVVNDAPTVDASAFDVARYVHENIPLDSKYLFVAAQSEAEWFPYLLRREPFASKWGSEWLGTYNDQRLLQSAIVTCRDLQSVDCLKQLPLDITEGDFLITRKAQRKLENQLELLPACGQRAVFGRYVVWSAECLMN